MKKVFSLVVLLVALQFGFSQVSVRSNSTYDKVRVGGSVGLNFGSNSYFGFNISPTVGYMLMPNLEAGISAGYQYGKSDFQKLNLFSGGPYVNYFVTQGLFARGHYEYFSGTQKYLRTEPQFERDIDESALWLGAGYSTPGPVRVQVGLMYNVLYKDDNNSIFSSPIRPFGGVAISL